MRFALLPLLARLLLVFLLVVKLRWLALAEMVVVFFWLVVWVLVGVGQLQ